MSLLPLRDFLGHPSSRSAAVLARFRKGPDGRVNILFPIH